MYTFSVYTWMYVLAIWVRKMTVSSGLSDYCCWRLLANKCHLRFWNSQFIGLFQRMWRCVFIGNVWHVSRNASWTCVEDDDCQLVPICQLGLQLCCCESVHSLYAYRCFCVATTYLRVSLFIFHVSLQVRLGICHFACRCGSWLVSHSVALCTAASSQLTAHSL